MKRFFRAMVQGMGFSFGVLVTMLVGVGLVCAALIMALAQTVSLTGFLMVAGVVALMVGAFAIFSFLSDV